MTFLAAVLSNPLVSGAIRIIGLSLLAGTVTALVSFVYRARVRKTLPEGATLILGLGAVAVYLNTRLIFIQFIGDVGSPLTVEEAVTNVTVFIIAGFASYGGRYAGNRGAMSERFKWTTLNTDLSPIVRATGRFTTVTLPENKNNFEDIEGYDPVQEETKQTLAGQTFDFRRGLTISELQSQLSERLKEDHDIGYVDIELTKDGEVTFLALGQRVAGLGPTLPPKSAAIAVRADPPFSATAGDTVQVWRTDTDGKEERVGTGELRAAVGSVATIATDEAIAESVDSTHTYRLMTLPSDSHPDKEFAAMLRRSEETMSTVDVGDDSPLIGNSIGSIDAAIIAVGGPDGDVVTIPERDRVIQRGDTLFAIGRPDTLRKLDSMKGTQLRETPERLQQAAMDAVRWEADD